MHWCKTDSRRSDEQTDKHSEFHWPLFSCAIRSARREVPGLISSWHMSTLARRMAGRACCSSSLPRTRLAPATITMAFWPATTRQSEGCDAQIQGEVSEPIFRHTRWIDTSIYSSIHVLFILIILSIFPGFPYIEKIYIVIFPAWFQGCSIGWIFVWPREQLTVIFDT